MDGILVGFVRCGGVGEVTGWYGLSTWRVGSVPRVSWLGQWETEDGLAWDWRIADKERLQLVDSRIFKVSDFRPW